MAITEDRADITSISKSMLVAVHRGGVDLIERWADDWRNLCHESVDDQPFYRPEWIAAHVRAFTPDAKVVLLTVSSEGRLLFVLPLLQEWAVFSGVPVRKLRAPVNSHSSRFDAVRHAGPKGDDAVIAAWDHLQKLGSWDMLECQDVLEGSVISSLSAVARQNGFHAVEVPARRSPYVPVPINPEEMKKIPRNSKLRSQLRQKRRELDSKGGLRLLRVDRSDPSAMNRFYELESAGWKGNEGSAIACNPKIRQFYDEVSESAGRFGYLCMYFLELNGELLAAHFGLSHRGRYFSPKIAYNEKLPQYAPGHLIVGEILQDCAFRGISEYDITGVDDEWKMKWTSETRAKFTHFVFSPGVAGTLAHTVRFRFRPAVKKMIRR